jgi:hypothetical protein
LLLLMAPGARGAVGAFAWALVRFMTGGAG